MKWIKIEELQFMPKVYQEVLLFDGENKDILFGEIYFNTIYQEMRMDEERGNPIEDVTHFMLLSSIERPEDTE